MTERIAFRRTTRLIIALEVFTGYGDLPSFRIVDSKHREPWGVRFEAAGDAAGKFELQVGMVAIHVNEKTLRNVSVSVGYATVQAYW